jgi:hypothetical protein
MNTSAYACNQPVWDKLTALKQSVDKDRKKALKERLTSNPQITDLEYLLGAFVQMYEPHLEHIILAFAKKGYAIDPQSGFSGKNAEIQTMIGDFSIDYVTKNKLDKLNIKFREHDGVRSLNFWPTKATLSDICTEWMKIVAILTDKGNLTMPCMSSHAIQFRRKYIPEHTNLQKERLFERLKFATQKKVEMEMKRRKVKNPHPDKIEATLGLFIEEIEPQVRQVIIILNKKGYSIDVFGFMDNSCDQMIEGDFQLEEETITLLQKEEVMVETNPSGYTRIQFSPPEANISKIKNKWNKIASILPKKDQPATPSMTRRAREFRVTYQ